MVEVEETDAVAITTRWRNAKIFLLLGWFFVISIVILVLVAVTLGVVIHRLDSATINDSRDDRRLISLVEQIKIDDLMKHLEQLQVIADQSNGTRAAGTQGFNDTLQYITVQLQQHTDFVIRHEYFTVSNYLVQGTPQFQSQINGLVDNYTYLMDFTHFVFSPGVTFDAFVPLVVIPNLGCQDIDWTSVSATNSIAIVKRGSCTFVEKSLLAEKYQVKGLLVYNDGTAPDRFQAIQNVRTHANATIPAYFLSYDVGMKLVNSTTNVGILMNINVSDVSAGNVCADTSTGNGTKTIVVGAHSDGVLDGSGINDNGSGTVAILILALNLARLLKTTSSNYVPYPYRVRFCWWGAEEIGLVGSIYHVEQASLPTATMESGRLQDYLLYFNYDMLASPNSNFGILDSVAIPPGTPSEALPGTNQITELFQQWFNDQELPWTESGIGGGSDFVPFLTSGIAAGGVNTGAGGIKSSSERDQYASQLGIGNSGVANVAYDSCYHQQCDRITNTNPIAYEIAVRAAAYALEYLGRLNDLEEWLYPHGRANNIELLKRNQHYRNPNDHTLL